MSLFDKKLFDRKKHNEHCKNGMLRLVSYLRTKDGGYKNEIDADDMVSCINWFFGDNALNLHEYIEENSAKKVINVDEVFIDIDDIEI